MISVLLIDDSRFMAKSLRTLLEEMDFEVVGLAHDGNQGLEEYERLKPDVTLLDVTMPNMDGVECLTLMKELDPDARVVMLSAIQDPATVEKCLELGASSFLPKPIRRSDADDLNRLRTTLEEAHTGACGSSE